MSSLSHLVYLRLSQVNIQRYALFLSLIIFTLIHSRTIHAYFLFYYCIIREGSQVASCGKSISINKESTIIMIKGKVPRMIVPMLKFDRPLIIKRFRPTGGVRSPISKTIIKKTPNQTELNPAAMITG